MNLWTVNRLLFRSYLAPCRLKAAVKNVRSQKNTNTAALKQPREVNISVTDGGRRLQAEWASSTGPSNYNSVWLRHNCQCSECLTSANQKSVLSYKLDPHVTIEHTNIAESGNLSMKWSCGHEGHLNLDWLKRHCHSAKTLEEARESSAPIPLTQGTMLRMNSKELNDERGILRWLKFLNEYGACLLTDVPCTIEDGLKIGQKISPNLQQTYDGERTEIEVWETPSSTAYSSSILEPHMDYAVYESHPGIVLMHCLRNDKCVRGGESIVVDALAVAEKLRVTHRHHFDTLVRVPATFHRIYYDSDNPVHMVYRTPHIHLDGHGQIVKLRWSPHNEGPLRVAEEDVQPYYEAYTCFAKALQSDPDHKLFFRLEQGDMLVVNDHRILHGRTDIELNGGERLINNFAINIDEFKSRLQVLCAKYDPDYQPKRVLNHDFSFSTAAAQ